MAALVYIAGSIGVHFYRAGCVFVATRGSITESFNYLWETRNQILEQRYLERLPSLYDDLNSNSVNTSRDRCIQCTSNKDAMEDDIQSSYDFISVESAVEAENYWRDVSIFRNIYICESNVINGK